jgi:hypothetical protein
MNSVNFALPIGKLEEIQAYGELQNVGLVQYLTVYYEIRMEALSQAIQDAKSLEDFQDVAEELAGNFLPDIRALFSSNPAGVRRSLQKAREILGLEPFPES